MERTRATWTDERLDDLSRRLDDGFKRGDDDLRELRSDVNNRFDALQRLIVQIGGGMIATTLLTLISVLATRG